eukprot:430906-Amphidinium_carterae.1
MFGAWYTAVLRFCGRVMFTNQWMKAIQVMTRHVLLCCFLVSVWQALTSVLAIECKASSQWRIDLIAL